MITAGRQPLGNLFKMLMYEFNRPVVDRTGLAGIYDFNLIFTPAQAVLQPPMPGVFPGPEAASVPDSTASSAPGLLRALRDQLGLELTPKNGPVDMLVVDRLNPSPTEN